MYEDNPKYVAFDFETLKRLAANNFYNSKAWVTDSESSSYHYRFYPLSLYREYGESHNFPKPVKIGDERYWLKDEINDWFKNEAPRWSHEELMK